MADSPDTAIVAAHYRGRDLLAAIDAALAAGGKDRARLTVDDLAPIDHFHGGGRTATWQLLAHAGLDRPLTVLDLGGGLGGPARTLAARTGSSVTVLDLSDDFITVGRVLSERLGLADRVTHRQGDSRALPFGAAAFDLVWAQNSLMNIAEKAAVYAEVARVLRPGGRFAFQEILAGPVTPAHYPTAWAADASTSHLWTAAATRTALGAAGFSEQTWVDVSAEQAQARRLTLAPGVAPLPGVPALLHGPDYAATANRHSVRNIEEGRTVIVQAVFARS